MTISPQWMPVLPVAILLGLLLLAAAIYDIVTFRRRRKHRDKIIYRCSACGRIYALVQRKPLARCPGCRHPNEPVRQ